LPTIEKLDTAQALAQTLHAQLSQFMLETLDPAAKAMWMSQTQSCEQILHSIEDRRRQLRNREQAIGQTQASIDATRVLPQ